MIYSTKVIVYYHSLKELMRAVKEYQKTKRLYADLSSYKPKAINKPAFGLVRDEILTTKYLQEHKIKKIYKIFLERSSRINLNEELEIENLGSIIKFFGDEDRQKFFFDFIIHRQEQYENKLPVDAVPLDAIETAFRESRENS